MQDVSQIKVGKHKTGIVGLKDTLKAIAKEEQCLSDQEISTVMIERLSKKNYIPSTEINLYEDAFIREYKKFIGEPVPEPVIDVLEIKVLGAGCPTCDKLEQVLMRLISENEIDADLEHVRDLREIISYGVMGSPALVINRTVKAVGSIPSEAELKAFIIEAQAELGN